MGGASSEWVEKGGVKSQWMERGDEVVKKAESAGELVKKGRASRQMVRLSIPGQDKQTGAAGRNDGQERRAGTTLAAPRPVLFKTP